MKIRNAKKEDLKEMVAIFITESKKRPFLQKWTKKSATEDFKPFLKKKELWVAVAPKGVPSAQMASAGADKVGNEIVGFIMVGTVASNKKVAYISEFWVTEKCQGKGVGKSLLEFVEIYHKKNGIEKIRLTSYNKSKAFGFYKKQGYKANEEVTPLEKKL